MPAQVSKKKEPRRKRKGGLVFTIHFSEREYQQRRYILICNWGADGWGNVNGGRDGRKKRGKPPEKLRKG